MASILNPQTFEQWLAVTAAMTSLVTVAGSALWHAWTYAEERRQKKWERLHQLVHILHNGRENGLWGQLAAISELRVIRIDQKVLATIVANAIKHFKNEKADQLLLTALAEFEKTLPKPDPS